MPRVRIKPGMHHRQGKARGGDVIEVTDDEVVSFGDKFILLDEEPSDHQRIIDGVAKVMADPPGSFEGIKDATIDATQGARELAAEHGISLVTIAGTGKDGRILISDVSEAIERGNAG